MKEQIFEDSVRGMLCRDCEDSVCRALLPHKGIVKADADFIRHKVKIEYDGEIITTEDIKVILAAAGYPAGVKKLSEYIWELLLLAAVVAAFIGIKALKLIQIPHIVSGTSYLMIFAAGLLTGAHCISMCGGIELSQTSYQKASDDRQNNIHSLIQYNIGRIVMAVALGGTFGTAGFAISYGMKTKGILYALTGMLMILLAVRMWGIIPALREISFGTPFLKLPPGIWKRAASMPILAGLLTGLMPCGASYAMWLVAAGSGSAVAGMLTMLVWSAGTVPLLLGFGIAGRVMPLKYSKWINIMNIFLIIMFGLSMIFMGLHMGR